MKVLPDTSVWSIALRRSKTAILNAEQKKLLALLESAIQDGRAVMIGPIRQELLTGIKEKSRFEKVKSLVEPFPDEPLDSTDYEEAARLSNVCLSRGIGFGTVDILICAVAALRGWQVISADTGLLRCLEIARAVISRQRTI